MTSSDRTVSGSGPGEAMSGACSHAELIDAYVDGAASAAERRLAERHLAQCEACRDEAEGLSALHALLASERLAPESRALDVRSPRLAGRRGSAIARSPRPAGRRIATVVRSPRPAGRRRAAVSAAALAALFGGALAALAAFAPAAGSAASAAATLFDFTVTVGLLGAGLLDASWRGLNAAMSSALQPAAPALLVGGAAAVSLGGLLVSLLRRGSKAAARQRSRR